MDAELEIVEYSYDPNGNMLSKLSSVESFANQSKTTSLEELGSEGATGAALYEYDVWNNLVKTIDGQNIVEMTYNGDGQRVSKSSGGSVTRHMYESDWVILEVDGNGNQTAYNMYGTDLLKRNVDGESLLYLYNGHSDVTALMTSSGSVAASYYYDAFGNITETTGQANNPFRYAGYQYDEESKLYYLNSRHYAPDIARFMQEDTYLGDQADPLSLNLYTYCSNNPLIYVDPTGHAPEDLQNEDKKIITKLQHYEDMMEQNKANAEIYNALKKEYNKIVKELRMKNRASADPNTGKKDTNAIRVTRDEDNKTINIDAYFTIEGSIAYGNPDANGNRTGPVFADANGNQFTYAEAFIMGVEYGWSGTYEQLNADGTITKYIVVVNAINLSDGKQYATVDGQESITVNIKVVQNIASGGISGEGDAGNANRTSIIMFDGDGRLDKDGKLYYTTDASGKRVRSNVAINGYWSRGTDADGMKEFMNTAAHEFGHSLGLNDTYHQDGYAFNDVAIVNRFDSIMNNPNGVGGKAQQIDYAVLFGCETWKTSSGYKKYSEARIGGQYILDWYFTDWRGPLNNPDPITGIGRATPKTPPTRPNK